MAFGVNFFYIILKEMLQHLYQLLKCNSLQKCILGRINCTKNINKSLLLDSKLVTVLQLKKEFMGL